MPWLISRYDLSFLPEIGALKSISGPLLRQARRVLLSLALAIRCCWGGKPPVEEGADPAAMTAALMASLAPLPESQDELMGLAEAHAAEPDSLMVGDAAAEAGVKTRRRGHRVVAFATHGLMAGDFGRLRELRRLS